MDYLDLETVIMAVVNAFGGKIEGRTLLQKVIFLIKQKVQSVSASFRPHYYGPYSDEVHYATQALCVQGLLTETREEGEESRTEFPLVRYIYELTEEGKKALDVIKTRASLEEIERVGKVADEIYNALEKIPTNERIPAAATAAKLFYILLDLDREASKQELLERAQKWGWRVKGESLRKGIQLLEKLNLIRVRHN